jgi:four helix bundle protein
MCPLKKVPVVKKPIRKHTDLDVYQFGYAAGMRVFELSKRFPKEERYSLTDQIRRSSRSVCGNLAEGWRKRRYPQAFVSKLTDSEAEAAETQSWLQFAVGCGYIDRNEAASLYKEYDQIIAMLVKMATNADDWSL